MSDARFSIDPAVLLAESRWLHGLAKSLVHDEHEAEDVVQGTLLTAITRPPRSADALKSWLARVGRRLAIRTGQQRQWRARREHLAARPEAQTSTVDLVGRASMHRVLSGFVLELAEPYRTTVLLRYFDDLPVRDIAARQAVSVEAVKTRLRRALAQLRARLDDGAGGRESWRGALAVPGGALVMATKTKVAAAAAVVLLAGAIAWQALRLTQSEDPAGSDAGALASSSIQGGAAASSSAPLAGVITPKRFEEPESRPESKAAAAAPLTRGARVSGRVLTADGRQPVAAEIFFHHIGDDYSGTLWRKSTAAGATRPDGTFELPQRVPPFSETGQVLALHEHGLDWVGFGVLPDTEEVTGLEILARRGWTLEVRVVDEQGRGIPGATVLVMPRFGPLGGPYAAWVDAPSSRPGEGALGRLAGRFQKATGADGSARFEGLPEPRLDPDELSPSGMTDVYAFKEGLDPVRERIVKLQPSLQAKLVLKPHRPVVVSGTVRRADNRPVAGAKLTLAGEPSIVTGESGEYRISTDRAPHNSVRLDCVAADFSAAVAHLPIEPGKDQRFDFKLLEARSITGRVLDETGAPVAGRVSITSVAGLRLAGENGGRLRTDGSFSFHGADSNQWWIEVEPERDWEAPRRRRVRGGDHVEITVARAFAGGATVEAELVDATTGNPVDPTAAQLYCRATFGGDRGWSIEPQTSRGLIRAEKVPPGPWRLWIHTAQFRRIQRDFTIKPSDQNVRLRIELEKPAAIVARVILDDVPAALRPQRLLVSIEDWNGIAVSAPGKPAFGDSPGLAIVDATNGWSARFEMVPPGIPVSVRAGQYDDPDRNHHLVDQKALRLAPGEERAIELRPAVAGMLKRSLSKPAEAGLVYLHREQDGTWVEDFRVVRELTDPIGPSTWYVHPGPFHWRVEFWPLDVSPRLRVPKVVEGEATIESGKVTEVTVEVP